MAAYRFDDVRVDVASFRVERGGRPVPLEPKAFDLLVLLLERQGQLVTKQEILDAVWRHTAVTDNALTRIVAHLRKALDDDARDARYIETVPTRGYRWLVPVARDEGAAPGPAPARERPRPWSGRPVLRLSTPSRRSSLLSGLDFGSRLLAFGRQASAGLRLTAKDLEPKA